MAETLKALLGDLHISRVRDWPPQDLETNIGQRRELVEAFDPKSIVQVGARLDTFKLAKVEGGTLSLDDIVADGGGVLIFFRFANCPACNVALPYYQRNLWSALAARGVPLIAISPQVPERLGEIRTRHHLGFTVASDPDNRLARQLGIAFVSNPASQAYVQSKGVDFPALMGTGNWELPQPAVIVIDKDRIVRFVDVAPDWMARTEAGRVLKAVDALQAKTVL